MGGRITAIQVIPAMRLNGTGVKSLHSGGDCQDSNTYSALYYLWDLKIVFNPPGLPCLHLQNGDNLPFTGLRIKR